MEIWKGRQIRYMNKDGEIWKGRGIRYVFEEGEIWKRERNKIYMINEGETWKNIINYSDPYMGGRKTIEIKKKESAIDVSDIND